MCGEHGLRTELSPQNYEVTPQAPGYLLRIGVFPLRAWNGGAGLGVMLPDKGPPLRWRPGLRHLKAGSSFRPPSPPGLWRRLSLLVPLFPAFSLLHS